MEPPLQLEQVSKASERQAQNKRRLARQVEEISNVVAQIAIPFPNAASVQRWSADGSSSGGGSGFAWETMPDACNPSAALSGRGEAAPSAKLAARARRKQLQVGSIAGQWFARLGGKVLCGTQRLLAHSGPPSGCRARLPRQLPPVAAVNCRTNTCQCLCCPCFPLHASTYIHAQITHVQTTHTLRWRASC